MKKRYLDKNKVAPVQIQQKNEDVIAKVQTLQLNFLKVIRIANQNEELKRLLLPYDKIENFYGSNASLEPWNGRPYRHLYRKLHRRYKGAETLSYHHHGDGKVRSNSAAPIIDVITPLGEKWISFIRQTQLKIDDDSSRSKWIRADINELVKETIAYVNAFVHPKAPPQKEAPHYYYRSDSNVEVKMKSCTWGANI